MDACGAGGRDRRPPPADASSKGGGRDKDGGGDIFDVRHVVQLAHHTRDPRFHAASAKLHEIAMTGNHREYWGEYFVAANGDVHFGLNGTDLGVFFSGAPMCFYGESPLGYACVFGLRRLVARMLDTFVTL